MKTVAIVMLVTVTVFFGMQAWLDYSSGSLPVMGELPKFSLTNQDGRTVTRKDFKGKIVVADFIFTNCPGPCPLMSDTMSELQKDLPDHVQFVSFTLDPERDTPAVLRAYGERKKADFSRWNFLTGDREEIYDLAAALKFDAQTMDGVIVHATRYFIVDAQGRIRGIPAVVFRSERDTYSVDAQKRNEVLEVVKELERKIPPTWIHHLPPLNASFNGTTFLLLVLGFVMIKAKKVAAHKACMLTGVVITALFLICYVTYHHYMGSTRFQGEGTIRIVYLVMLFSHMVLAALVVPLASLTLTRAFRGDDEGHKRIAWVTFPIWLYVSITGVLVYFFLYHY